MSDPIPERPQQQSSFTSRRPAASNLPHFSLPPPPDVPSAKTSATTTMSGGPRQQDFGGSAAAASHSSTPPAAYPQLTGSWPTPLGRMPSAYGPYNPPGSQEQQAHQQLPKVHPPSPFQQFLSSISNNPFPGAGQPTSTRDGDAGAPTQHQQPAASRTDDDPAGSQAFNSTATAPYQLPGYSSYRQPPSPGYYYPASTTPQQSTFPPFPPPQPSPTVPSPSASSSTYRATPIVPSSYPSHPSPKLPGPGPSDTHPRPGLSPLGGLPGMDPPPQHHNPPPHLNPPLPQQPSPGPPPQQPQHQQPPHQPPQEPWPGALTRPLMYPHHPPHHGPVMSNLHQPGTPMSLVPGGSSHHSQQFGQPFAYRMTQCGPGGYGSGPGGGGGASGSGANQDRPFKCDQCPQSFNRNHDLKRHKRIHLPVKPFPCGVCEKSFSRKDALKVSAGGCW